MAKKITICVLLVLLIGGAYLQNVFFNNATERLEALLLAVQDALDKEDMAEANRAADVFYAQWEKEKQVYEALIDHEDIDLMSATAARLHSYCLSHYRQGALAETHALLFYIRHLRDVDNIRWENIF